MPSGFSFRSIFPQQVGVGAGVPERVSDQLRLRQLFPPRPIPRTVPRDRIQFPIGTQNFLGVVRDPGTGQLPRTGIGPRVRFPGIK